MIGSFVSIYTDAPQDNLSSGVYFSLESPSSFTLFARMLPWLVCTESTGLLPALLGVDHGPTPVRPDLLRSAERSSDNGARGQTHVGEID